MPQEHHQFIDGKRLIWNVSRLIELSKALPVHDLPLSSITEFDSVYWFDSVEKPTCRAVAEHTKRILEVDLNYPIILSRTGCVMDGMHRVARAFLNGDTSIKAVQFNEDPEPDQIEEM